MTAAVTPPVPDVSTLPDALERAWARSDALFGLLQPAAFLQRPIALRQPFLFYVGHLAAFARLQVIHGVLGRAGSQPALDALFARGIDPVGVDAYDGGEAWPTLEETLRYRDAVRAEIRGSFDAVAARGSDDVLAEQGRVYHVVIEHELMHHETLLYMMQQLDRALLRRPATMPEYRFGSGATGGSVSVPGGAVTLGADFASVPFGWDNEFPAHEVEVAPFRIDQTPVSNAEWLEFVRSGGYQRRDLWTADAWEWRVRTGRTHPAFWMRVHDAWCVATLADLVPLREAAAWPVAVSWAEASAYAAWRGGRLPTEAEFHAASRASGVVWGDPARGNFDFTHWAPVPSGSYDGDGVLDLVGNGWEWTATRFGPFTGFRPWARTYPGYSADFFDTPHYVMLGASWATDRSLVRRSFRNWFQPHYPFVFAKFRLVRDGP